MSAQIPSISSSQAQVGAPDAPIFNTVRSARSRIRRIRLLRSLSLALGCGAAIGLIVIGLSKLRLYVQPSPAAIVGLLIVALVIGALIALVPALPDIVVARLIEQRADLKERLSSALEFQQTEHATEPLYTLQLADAARHAGSVDLKALFPIRVPRVLLFTLPALLALFLIYFVPVLPNKQQRAEAAEVKLRGIQILKLALDTKKAAEQQKLPETRKAAEEVRKLGEAMRHNKLTKKEALVAQQKLTRKMEEQQQRLAQQQAPKSLEQAGKQLKKSMEEMQKEAEKAQQKRAQESRQASSMQKPGLKPQQTPSQEKESEAMRQARAAMRQMQQAMQQQSPTAMQQAMQKMAQAMQKGGMSQQELQRMARMMQQMAQAMQGTQMKLSAEQMQQVAQMMQGSNGMDSKQMEAIANMMRQIGNGMGKPSESAQAALDAKALGDLISGLKEGRLTVPGNGNGRPGFGPGGRGPGYGGKGFPSKPMKDPGITHPKLQAISLEHASNAQGKNGSITAFQKYLAQPNPSGRHLPNGQIKGTHSQNGQELSMQMTGDPTGAQSNTPYYQAVETSRKQAESALSKESVPATMKKQVHDYFDSIR
jgi:hypothetical protein